MKDSTALEKLVARIQSQLAPNSKVEHNVNLSTLNGNRTRQVDVLVTDKIGQYEFIIVIDCKDHVKKLDVREIGTFHDLVKDVGAHRGVLVCPKGFTSGALDRAKELKIDLYSPVDTEPHKWQILATAPCIVDYRSAAIAINISVSSPQPWVIPYDITKMNFYDKDENPLPPLVETMFANWFNGSYPIDAGIYEKQPIYKGTTLARVNLDSELKMPIDLSANVHVEQRYYFGHAKIEKISGFLDHKTGGVITNAFELLVDHDKVESTWKVIDAINNAPVKPLFVSIGLIAHRLS